MNTYQFKHCDGKTVSIEARSARTAQRRYAGYARGELDIHGKTILASKRKPPGRSMNPNRTAKGLKKKA